MTNTSQTRLALLAQNECFWRGLAQFKIAEAAADARGALPIETVATIERIGGTNDEKNERLARAWFLHLSGRTPTLDQILEIQKGN